ncbi:MAG: double-strand break repair helicase AddA [Micavibrio aeruginosavorus]|uniref:DNA 3'-5' helicase n=1 Tax=Micavibrio aeruginosavorus TaxID=349221 RepID=A0A7T5UGH2_9BACT|nr:MAG: double-strand break repair helicase AddA [Micavibrio aeruginosavorus]
MTSPTAKSQDSLSTPPLAARRPDPNHAQRAASDPESSVWVSASAGSGKTKVLTDRVLRLLLPRADGSPGTPPEKILCLTYTKAGANEMALRIGHILSLWATISLESSNCHTGLREYLQNLLGRSPREEDIAAARCLFAVVADAPGGIKIVTIHAFCQSILGRFPLEAGLTPHFKVLGEIQSQDLMRQARDYILKNAVRAPQDKLNQALSTLATALSDDRFADLLETLNKERHTLDALLQDRGGAEALYRQMCSHLRINPENCKQDLILAACQDCALNIDALRALTPVLCSSEKSVSDKASGEILARWLSAAPTERAALFDTYTSVFLTVKGEIRSAARIATNESEENFPGLRDHMLQEARRLKDLQDQLRALTCARMTYSLLLVGESIIRRHQELKSEAGGLDFEDMIGRTRWLLTKAHMAAWVLYKLDGGLDHILVDEAQDTNPEQWDIVESLVQEFFSGVSARDIRRTLFVVGDEKQSIFSFQRAAPERFRQKRSTLQTVIEGAGENWKTVPMDVSFRSTSAVLDFADAVFSDDLVRQGVSESSIQHFSFRQGHAGHIEQWPLFRVAKAQKEKNESYWKPSLAPAQTGNARALLARHVAETIENWLKQGEVLASRGRAVQPGDIMILVKNRNGLVNQMLRELKLRNIPVNGIDRMKLVDHIAVQDLMAAARFALQPRDDLSLACLLKSPLLNWDDRKLEDVALGRPGLLWDEVRHKTPSEAAWLELLIQEAKNARPYEFFSRLLQSPCPASAISGLHAMTARLSADIIDPLDEFLNQVLSFEGEHVSSVQGFILWQERNQIEIKREQEEAGGRIRIMTIHASKGLQAPIVILPDTIIAKGSSGSRASNRLLWPAKTGLPFPFWSPETDCDCAAYTRAKEKTQTRDDEEYRRLLYVALTRAEDRLYIGGAAGDKDPDEKSWYELTQAAFHRFDQARTIPFQGSATVKALWPDNGPAPLTYILHTEQKATSQDKVPKGNETVLTLPDMDTPEWRWCRTAPPPEPALPRPLIPSRAIAAGEDTDAAALSPLQAQNNYRFLRGNLTHRLLQLIPGLTPEAQERAAQAYAARYGQELPEVIREDVVAEVLAILKHPEWSELFGPHSQAEVPITGIVEGKLLSGQIDRLLVTSQEIRIIDYKSNRPPPVCEEDVPEAYRAQLRAYRDTLASLYPDRAIKTCLLWTDGPRLMEISL